MHFEPRVKHIGIPLRRQRGYGYYTLFQVCQQHSQELDSITVHHCFMETNRFNTVWVSCVARYHCSLVEVIICPKFILIPLRCFELDYLYGYGMAKLCYTRGRG